jgi:plastocyanin
MRPPLPLALLAVIVVAGLSWGQVRGEPRPVAAQETVTVAVGDFFFCDPSLAPGACQTVVDVGDTVTWEDRTGTEGHTVTDCGESCDAATSTPLFDSGGLSPGQTFSFTFTAPGTYRYLCRFHPEAMRAEVLVQAAPTATATQPVASPTSVPTVQASPTGTQVAPPSSGPSASPTPSLGATDEGDDGPSPWVWVLAGVGGGVIVLGAGVLALRRLR